MFLNMKIGGSDHSAYVQAEHGPVSWGAVIGFRIHPSVHLLSYSKDKLRCEIMWGRSYLRSLSYILY